MRNLLLTISYKGTNYHGFQVQKNAVTVAETLQDAMQVLFKGERPDIKGCSRTDAGVHANMFCATVTKKNSQSILTELSSDKIPMALNAHLPPDISVFYAEFKSEDFHPRYDVKYKEYVYQIWNRPERNPFVYDRSWHYPKHISDKALAQMNLAAAHFVGTHDFASYMASDSKICDTVRTIYEAEVTRKDDMVIFRVCANGFLYNMVRILTGTLLAVAEGKITPKDIPLITDAKDRRFAGITVPAHGLFLNRVVY